MKKSSFKKSFFLLSSLILTGCSVIAINFNALNIVATDIETDFSIVQLESVLIWGAPDSEKDYTYDLYKNGEYCVQTEDAFFVPLTGGLFSVGDKIKVVAKDGTTSVAETKEYQIKAYSTIPAENDAEIQFKSHRTHNTSGVQGEYYSNGKKSFDLYNDRTFTISKNTNSVLFKDFAQGNYHIEIEERKSPLFVFLRNTSITGLTTEASPVFDYKGKDKNALVYFILDGSNEIGGGSVTNSYVGADAISIPRVGFVDSGSITVQGRSSSKYDGNSSGDTGYAVKANNIYNLTTSKDKVNLIGAKGCKATGTSSGEAGHFPINKDAMIKVAVKGTLAIKAGDGGNGKDVTGSASFSGNGGDTYAYSYLTRELYSKYKYALNDSLGNPIPGYSGTAYTESRRGSAGKLIE